MQTFVPYASFFQSAQVLDRQRLGKQRVEVLQLLNALSGEGRGWANHPAAIMWQGYENALVSYGLIVCDEWLSRGYKDTCYEKIRAHFDSSKTLGLPPWWGQVDVHVSHQSNLVRKNPDYYRPFFPNVPDDLDYVWPVAH